MPPQTASSAATGDGGATISNQLAMLVPGMEPGVDDVQVWTGKVELLLATWPKDKLNELAMRLILNCKGSLFMKLQLHKDEIMTGDTKGVKRLVELVGGSWGQIPLEQKFEIVEKALFKCVQKADETLDSFLSRCDVVWSDLLIRKVKLEELQAYILLRGSRLSPDDRKRVIVEAGAESGGVLEMKKVTAAVRMLGSGFFNELTGNKRDRSQKVYDQNAFLTEEIGEQDSDALLASTHDEVDEEMIEILAAENDEDANLIVQFEDAVMDTLQSDVELAAFFTSYQEARRRLSERVKVRGFWPVHKKGMKGGGKKGKVKSKGKQSLAQRIANSYCRLCHRRGHWKAECPDRQDHDSSASSAKVAPTTFVTVDEVPMELAEIPEFTESNVTSRQDHQHVILFGVTLGSNKQGLGNKSINKGPSWNKVKFQQGLRARLRYESPSESRNRSHSAAKKPSSENVAIGWNKGTNINTEECDTLFASTGTTGVVDLGASQSVIGNQQVPELMKQLPDEIRQQVRRTNCSLTFRFGNHQTLESHHALLFPLLGKWFRVAVVKGNTPFLLSSKFLKETVGAVIDTVEGTMWSKTLNRQLPIELTIKNLYLLDINNLWKAESQSKLETFHVQQVQPDVSSLGTASDRVEVVNRSTDGTDHHDITPCEVDKHDNDTHRIQHTPSQVESCDNDRLAELEGPKSSSNPDSSCEFSSPDGQDVSCRKVQGLPGEDQGLDQPGGDEDHRSDDTGRVVSSNNRLWEVKTGVHISHGVLRPGMDKLVCEPIRAQCQKGAPQVRSFRGADDGGRTNSSSEPEQGEGEDEGLCCQSQGSSLNNRSGSIMGTSAPSGRDLGIRPLGGLQSESPRGGSGLHASGVQTVEHPDDCHGEHHERDRPALEEDAGQDRGLRDLDSDQAETLLASTGTLEGPDCDYDFFTEAQSQNYHRECQRLIQLMWKELSQVYQQTKLFPKSCKKLDLLEVMCSNDSVLTEQVNRLGGSAQRFGLSEGDLQQSCHRKKLFEILIRHTPEHLWYSPVCAPWCMWSFLNCTKNIDTGLKIMEQRWQNLWQLSLAVVLYRFQKSHNAQFSLEQPSGSLMLKVPCMDEIVSSLSWCQFDMCQVGNLVHPETSEPIRKRMIVCTSSRALHQSLQGKLCNSDHKHALIQGQVMVKGERIRLSTFTEKYPLKFGRQIAKLILKEKNWDSPIYANETDDHPTKRRRLGKKANSAEIEQMFPCVNWQTALHIADRTAPRVGIQIIDSGPLFKSVQ